ncbi:hypothetical protein CLD20_07735 [Afifella sp. IM 167]|nr:hypothetical protein [Afifella sp. IM 167]
MHRSNFLRRFSILAVAALPALLLPACQEESSMGLRGTIDASHEGVHPGIERPRSPIFREALVWPAHHGGRTLTRARNLPGKSSAQG